MSQRRPKDRSHWGDEAFRAMHNKPITREVLHKALQEPTAREVLDGIVPIRDAYNILASRIEAVLALLEKYRTIPADLIERVLDGGKP